ncbi:NADH:flavorubredoxin reductase NorW [uncultured Ferrimonas sp.]|uniref:NADH:flavorubredoxin reductase NorW n=1 Tax=uncultured Ferrimonas sp. TaxID=432640 RepID=UPI00261FF525|nr:NADH:flavorubredoxin reductase NorW [uncultured Ferrimonas sp.]
MTAPIVIIGSGFAAYQLVKTLRKQDSNQPITVLCADAGHDYNKPELSHVISRSQSASELIKQHADEFAQQQQITLHSEHRVSEIDRASQRVCANGHWFDYSKLVLATGASAMVPPMAGDAVAQVLTLNSLQQYQQAEAKLQQAKRVLVLGAGLIGTELAMDIASSNRQVVLVDLAKRLLPALLPPFVSSQLQQRMAQSEQGQIDFALGTSVTAVNQQPNGLQVQLANGASYQVDALISAIGLRPNTQLAQQAGLHINRGIVVDQQLRSSDANVFAIGDCAEMNDKVQPFLQPALLGANALAKTLLGQASNVMQPTMLVKVKTPWLPITLAGTTTDEHSQWQIELDGSGLVAKAFNGEQLVGAIATEQRQHALLPLLRQISQPL